MKNSVPNTKNIIVADKLNSSNSAFPIVAIGASAGGLEAVSEFFQNLSPTTGMAFLYVQHLSPDHKSMLDSLLAKTTSMKVQQAENQGEIVPNNVYVIPPDKEMNIVGRFIKLTPRPESPKINLPIDILFSSLAGAHKENVIGIILSGSATDGTRGMKAIKHEGGLTFAQDETAKFGSMPNSAIAAGAVDLVLSPKKIALEISRLSKHPYIKSNGTKPHIDEEIANSNPSLKIILNLLHKTQGVDFSQYKMATVKRRIMRRMLLYKIKSLKEYATLLKEKKDEINILYQDLLINVTAFFRDSETYEYLKTTLFPNLLKTKKPDESLRIWVAACSTGEEAYSIAITLLEIQKDKSTSIPVQIFATDLDAKAIAKARIGEYSKNELEEISPTRLQQFYDKSQNGYRVAKSVRDMCVFAQHNLLSDPPFAHVDFISCCNLLIYLDTAAQKKAIATFHHALNENGNLMLGKSETVGQSTQIFSIVNTKFKIYSRKNDAGPRTLPDLAPRFKKTPQPEVQVSLRNKKPLKTIEADHGSLDKAIDAVMLSRFMPASVVINENLEILQFRGDTDSYISPSTGKATLNILKMTRPEIAVELRSAISKALRSKESVRRQGVEIKSNEMIRSIGFEVVPLHVGWSEPVLIIVFSEQQQTEIIPGDTKGTKSTFTAKDRRIKLLEEELAAAHANMLAFSLGQQAFNEELQGLNEEVVSSNEELQIVNEELETSKEEIESTNEELITSNQELLTRNELLNESYHYSETLLLTIHLPLVILDSAARVKSANHAFYTKYKVSEQETEGNRIYDLGNGQWNIPKLRNLIEEIIPNNTVFENYEVEHEFEDIGKKIMLLNARRIYLSGQELILLAITDITEVRNLELEKVRLEKNAMQEKIDAEQKISEAEITARKKIEESELRLRLATESSNAGTLDYNIKTGELFWSEKMKLLCGYSIHETITPKMASSLIHPEDAKYLSKASAASLLPSSDGELEIEYRIIRPNDKQIRWVYSRSKVSFEEINGKKEAVRVTGILTDITERKKIEEALKESEKQFRFIADAMPQKVWTSDERGNINYFNKQWLDYTGMNLEELQNEGWEKIIHSSDLSKTSKRWKKALETGKDFESEDRKRDKDGNYKWHLSRAYAFRDETGQIKMWIGTDTEIEKQKMQSLEFENAVKERTKELQEQRDFSETIVNTTVDLIGVYDKEMRFLEFNKACEDLFKIKKEQVLGKKFTDVFASAIGGKGENDLKRALNGETIHNTIYYSQESGRYYENLITPLKHADGEIYAAIAIAHDITESLEATENLKQSEEKFNKLFAASPLAMVLSEIPSGKISDANEIYFETIGYSKDECIGKTSLDLKVIDEDATRKIADEFLVNGFVRNVEIQITRKNEEQIPVLISIEKIRIGVNDYFLSAIIDIIDRKEAEQQMDEKNIVLQKMNKELEAFTYISSHDLQEPLRKIQTFTAVLLEKEHQNLSDKGKEYFRRMQGAAKRMQTLIQDLLSFSRVNTADRKFELTDLNKIIEEVKTELKDTIEDRHAIIEVTVVNEVKIIPFQFRQLMLNLISNALKFSKTDTPPHIVIKSEIISAANSPLANKETCHLSILDNGIGFEQHFSEQIFQVFQRLHGTDEYAGTGIGLAIVKKIVENHNGIVTASGDLGKGATFDIYIPA